MFLDAVDCYDAFRRISEGTPKVRGTDKKPEGPVPVASLRPQRQIGSLVGTPKVRGTGKKPEGPVPVESHEAPEVKWKPSRNAQGQRDRQRTRKHRPRGKPA